MLSIKLRPWHSLLLAPAQSEKCAGNGGGWVCGGSQVRRICYQRDDSTPLSYPKIVASESVRNWEPVHMSHIVNCCKRSPIFIVVRPTYC